MSIYGLLLLGQEIQAQDKEGRHKGGEGGWEGMLCVGVFGSCPFEIGTLVQNFSNLTLTYDCLQVEVEKCEQYD